MTDKELADRIVAFGVGGSVSDGTYRLNLKHNEVLTQNKFVRDWRVAGALMEMCVAQRIHLVPIIKSATVRLVRNESLPRAINEACSEVLE